MRVKICGLTRPDQGYAIAQMGATALGFICVQRSPRYVTPTQIRAIIEHLPAQVARIGVFANETSEIIHQVVTESGLNGVQLHGNESIEFCRELGSIMPDIELIKAIRVKNKDSLAAALSYGNCVHTLLLDAYHPKQLGGTGQTLDWDTLAVFKPPIPWLLAGGLNPDNILEALTKLNPDGIDLSSGVERSPGDKDLNLVALLFQNLRLSSFHISLNYYGDINL